MAVGMNAMKEHGIFENLAIDQVFLLARFISSSPLSPSLLLSLSRHEGISSDAKSSVGGRAVSLVWLMVTTK